MKIETKVNLILILSFIIGILLSGIVLSNVLQKRAQKQMNAQNLMLIEINHSIKNYTSEYLKPLLINKLDNQDNFIPEAIPSFSAQEIFKKFRTNSNYQNYLYKDATLNPTNVQEQADYFETNIINIFHQEPDKTSLSGFRQVAGKKLYYTAKPFVINNESCLRCYSTPNKTPTSQLATYGDNHDFGWKLNEVLGIQIIYIPAEKILEDAHRSFVVITGIVTIIFTALIIVMNLLLLHIVLQRIKKIIKVTKQVSRGNTNVYLGKQHQDEIEDLVKALYSIKYRLEITMLMLDNLNS